ncbi:FIST N-terminal domain-containing protein [Pseudalkalibacillus sp. A8]|uniref:FIST N-terminal domain-containing protein n=1 Tax=Pseudalkalibacillus sp. A8 TaxID=3382641 RepID=UPI0038B5DB60
MKTVSTIYHNRKQLESFIESKKIQSDKNVLIQIYTAEGKVRVSRLWELLSQSLPEAAIIGATVDATYCSAIKTSGTAVSFTVFDKVQVKSIGVSFKESVSGYEYGVEIGAQIIKPDTKAVILFGSSHTLTNRAVLKALEERFPHTVMAGGNAVPVGEKNVEFLVTNDGLIDSGVTAVSLSGDELIASVHAYSEWNTVGRSFTDFPNGKAHAGHSPPLGMG